MDLSIWGSVLGETGKHGETMNLLRSPRAEGGVDSGGSGSGERRQWAAVAVAPARRTWDLLGGHGHGSFCCDLRVGELWRSLKIELKWTERQINKDIIIIMIIIIIIVIIIVIMIIIMIIMIIIIYIYIYTVYIYMCI